MSKVLFVYPNGEGYPIIPIGIALLAGILKKGGHEVKVFDTTFMMSDRVDHDEREKKGITEKVDVTEFWGSGDEVNIPSELQARIKSFDPDIVAFSIVEDNYWQAKELIELTGNSTGALLIVGGLFPTVVPEYFMDDPNVDLICVGEGERPLLELADRVDKGEAIDNIPNLIMKNKSGEIIRNSLCAYYDWEPQVFQDWDEFDERHLIKPFMGKMWKTGFFELSRGCPHRCSYCINDELQKLFDKLGIYSRKKEISAGINEIMHFKEKYGLELIFFNDENFLNMGKQRLDDFCAQYKKKIDLPFFIMTRADTLVKEEAVKLLKEAGCITVGIGVESGSERIRKEVMNKGCSNKVYEKAFETCHKYDLRTTANVMIGLPGETEEDITETALFCRKVQAKSISLAIFAPYQGTKLHRICVERGYLQPGYDKNISINNSSILNMPQISKEKINELMYKFNDLVYPKD